MKKTLPYNTEVRQALDIAQKIAKENNHPFFTGSHLLKALLNRDLSLLKKLENLGVDVFYLEEWAEVRIEDEPKKTQSVEPEPGEIIDTIFDEANDIALHLGEDEITLFSLVISVSTPGVAFSFEQMKSYPISRSELLQESKRSVDSNTDYTLKKKTSSKFIDKYCIDKLKETNKYDYAIVGRATETQQIVEILSRFSKPNILLIGDSGVGKTAIIKSFIDRVRAKEVPDWLADLSIYELDMSALIAGASYKGEIEDRLKNIAQELRVIPKSVLIIEELHTLLSSHSDSGVANLLKGELAKGLRVIATSNIAEYTKKIEKEASLAGMFELINIEEIDEDIQFRILKEVMQVYENHHNIKAEDDVLWGAIRLSKRYMKEKSLPASALDLIDHTMSVAKSSGEIFLKEKQNLYKRIETIKNLLSEDNEKAHKEIEWLKRDLVQKTKYLTKDKDGIEFSELSDTEESIKELEKHLAQCESVANEKRTHITDWDLALVVSQKTNIPLGKLQEDEKERLSNMEATLAKRVVGQDHAISIVTEAVLENRSGLSKAGQPIGSFFFLGPTGTGKTELAKSLASFLFQDENAIIRFDMSEFKEEHAAALLYGAPPGYVGYEEGGLLVNKIRQKPYSIVLFDEIEKAHASVFDVFLQIMDEGKLHDRLGKEGDFSNAIILFTSNIGSEFIVKSFEQGNIPTSSDLLQKMSHYFRPEFLGRLTETIPFAPITKENALKIFEIHLKKELLDLVENLGISLNISDKAKEQLTLLGYDSTYGARPLKGVIRSRLRRPLARKIVSGIFSEGDCIEVDWNEEDLVWKKV